MRYGKKDLLGGWVLREGNSLLDVVLETLDTSLNKFLLMSVGGSEDVVSLFSATRLETKESVQATLSERSMLTPSSTGTEKKSQPVSFAISSPPETPGR